MCLLLQVSELTQEVGNVTQARENALSEWKLDVVRRDGELKELETKRATQAEQFKVCGSCNCPPPLPFPSSPFTSSPFPSPTDFLPAPPFPPACQPLRGLLQVQSQPATHPVSLWLSSLLFADAVQRGKQDGACVGCSHCEKDAAGAGAQLSI
jgi:hypothetical protein